MPRRLSIIDERAGLSSEAIGNTSMSRYQAKAALAVLDGIAEGKTLKEVCKAEGMPQRQTIYRWIALYPEFSKAYYAARELSAQSLEEEALDMAKVLKDPNDFTGTKIKAYEVAMSQFRWSAARRDPRRYGQRAEDRIIVPIQINTTLDLGGEAAGGLTTPDGDNVYSMRSKVEAVQALPADPRESQMQRLEAEADAPPEEILNDPDLNPYTLPATVSRQRLIPPATPAPNRERAAKRGGRPRHKSDKEIKRALTNLKNKGLYEPGKTRDVLKGD